MLRQESVLDVELLSTITKASCYESERYTVTEAATGGVLIKKVFLGILQNSQENTCVRVSFLTKFQTEACNFILKKTLAQVFSCEICEISKNSFFLITPLVAASSFLQYGNAENIMI